MLIILEGCDGSGKTTLAKFLKDILGGKIVHITQDTPNDFQFFWGIVSASTQDNTTIIMDRAMYGQFIYQTEAEREAKGWLTDDQLVTLETFMLGCNVVPILCVAGKKMLQQRINRRGNSMSNFDKLDQVEIQNKFLEFIHNDSLLTWTKVSCDKLEWGQEQWQVI